MDNTLKDLLFQLGWEKRSLIQDYIEKIANKGLTRYKTIIQTGKKQGESLYTHILDGIFVFERLRPLLGVAEIEAKVIMTVYSVHDLNKVERFAGGGSYNKIGIKANFEEELRSVGMHEFFPEYQEYLEDITTLARAHSGHYHTDGELLIKSHNPYKLGKERIEDLKYVIRAMDVIDLSQTLTERTQKDKFLSELNTYLSKQTPVRQYEFHTHQVSENRGILTNLIHNRIAEYLEQQCGMLPLLFYPDGVAYLLEKGKPIPFTADDLKAIGQKVSASINRMTKSKFSTEFITSTQQGIKVDGKFRELGLTFEEIFTEIYNMVVGRIYQKRLADMVKKAKDRTVETMKKKAEKLKDQQEQDNSLQQAIEIAQLTAIMPDSDEGMRVGELLRSYYIFLSTHYEKEIPNTWDYLYTLLDIETSRRQFYDAFDPRYDRPYVVAKDLTMSLDEMKTFIIEAGNKLATTSVVQPQEDLIHEETPIEKYVCRHVNFNFMLPQKAQFLENLKVYLNNPGSQCCYCGSAFDTDKWMSADVPGDVKVQYFSNRLEGGQREPKRHICEICNTQFILYKLNYPTISPGNLKKQGVNTYYLHLFPYAFYPEMFLQALRTTINRLKGLEVESLYLKGESAIREYMKSSTVELKFSKAKVNGFPLPKFTEVQGNMLLFPVNCMGDNESERFLFAVENALLMQKYLGCKVVLTDSSVGIVEQSEFDDLYIDSIPATFRGLLPTNNLSQDDLGRVWKRLTTLYTIKGLIYTDGKELPELIRALSEDELTLYYVCERFILKQVSAMKGNPDRKLWQEITRCKEVGKAIHLIIERSEKMEQLKVLAQIAWEGKIKGESLKKNALMMPFDMAFEMLHRKSDFVDLATIQAALVEDIFAYLDRIAKDEYKPGGTKREKIKAFVDMFFSGLLKEVYHNNINKLLADEKILKSAFLFHVREQIPGKKAENE